MVAGGTPSQHGWSKITLGGPDILSAYLGFTTLADYLAAKLDNLTQNAQAQAESRSNPIAPATVERNTVFVLMSMDPSDPSLTDVCNAIKEVCAQFDLQAYRIDDTEPRDQITGKILALIASSEFILADLSGERPNVYYEVGYAHAIGKHPILQRRVGTKLHFDLSVHNVPEYHNITELKATLRRRLSIILGRRPRLGPFETD